MDLKYPLTVFITLSLLRITSMWPSVTLCPLQPLLSEELSVTCCLVFSHNLFVTMAFPPPLGNSDNFIVKFMII